MRHFAGGPVRATVDSVGCNPPGARTHCCGQQLRCLGCLVRSRRSRPGQVAAPRPQPSQLTGVRGQFHGAPWAHALGRPVTTVQMGGGSPDGVGRCIRRNAGARRSCDLPKRRTRARRRACLRGIECLGVAVRRGGSSLAPKHAPTVSQGRHRGPVAEGAVHVPVGDSSTRQRLLAAGGGQRARRSSSSRLVMR